MPGPSFERIEHILSILSAYDPHDVGTPALGLAVPDSDFDIICHAHDLDVFARHVWDTCSAEPDFAIRQWAFGERAVIATFRAGFGPVEIFGSTTPVREQAAWLHHEAERRLLLMGGVALRESVMSRRSAGLKTEPAFASALGLIGDPYQELGILALATDDVLRRLVASALGSDRRKGPGAV